MLELVYRAVLETVICRFESYLGYKTWAGTQVVKGAACKPVIHWFESSSALKKK